MTETVIPFELVEKYGTAAPRYTSYPTAPHFRHNPPESYVAYLLSNQSKEAPFSLYFHIPFCRQLCHYCGCFTKVINHDQPMKDYLRLLIREINLAGEIMGYKPPVSHIHYGGGTPNILAPEDLERILDAVRNNFNVLGTAEIAMEIDPRHLTEEKVKGYSALGLSRASVGVQDFHDNVQRAINRIQPHGTIVRCMEWLRKAGLKSVNFDLMYGLPLQTAEDIEDNIDKAACLSPDRIALFGYAHVPWMRSHQKLLEKYEMPSMAARFEQQERARVRLVKNGYHAIGMDHFALPGDSLFRAAKEKKLRRNFQGYTADDTETILGFGLSSISTFPQAYIQNTTDYKTYKDRLMTGQLPTAKGCILGEEDRMRREIIQNLMCHFEADLGAICRKYRVDMNKLDQSFENLSCMIEDGMISINGNHIDVTEKGRPFVRVVCVCFDNYIAAQESEARHAQSV